MKKNYLIPILISCFVSATATIASAADLSFGSPVALTVFDTNSVSTWETSGNDMAGMVVTVNYLVGPSDSTTWNLGGDNTGAVGNSTFGWSLTMTNYDANTFYGAQWLFEVTDDRKVESFSIEALPGNTVFDIFNDPKSSDDSGYTEKTPGSENGNAVDLVNYDRSWEKDTSYAGNIHATYSGAVTYNNDATYGDLYQTLTIEFNKDGNNDLFDSDDFLAFYTDTDNLVDPVPEPATLILFGAGLAMLAGRRLTRKK